MSRFRDALAAVTLAGLLAGTPAMGQSPGSPQKPAVTKPAKPAGGLAQRARKEWDGVGTMTRRQWNAMKRRWARETQKWTACNADARRQKLSAANSWTYVGKCMIK
jgi:hypothetical protein